ncbi:MAG: Holliday junction resolvase RuvX [Candidatus Marinimicrobia bacterium]|nr:Holliday junction resolvase RuvX [Candidatus Neomarinimicrobiota bacterium]MBT3634135.1 Holliday junction resolvase RuvX [Candidatus Neomarinimicrobiota bacterium]MBT3683172.1 Holliday junction resolvase RuvX [Candidatus Neomarinimicrobiota bacterium]MBT3759780.1 Holliday junction resolvase RuvX [Candidatus Neomarinimicrobiota bacterium]MBT3895814.1 Holliday junction resolvase RuvX [Candidatus Neomarinimicrobiota bacterium]
MLGIDFGDRRIGIAISDPLKIVASPHSVIDRKKTADYFKEIHTLVQQHGVEKVVVGLPLNMKGVDSPQTLKVRDFITQLENQLGIDVIPVDERLSTKAARGILLQKGVKSIHQKESIDQIAAAVILQEYLDSN